MRLSFSVLPLLLSFAATPAQDKHLLRLDLPENKPIFLVHTSDVTIKFPFRGKTQETTKVLQFFTEMKVVAVKEGVHDVEERIYRMKIQQKGPMMDTIDYDSDVTDANAGWFADAAKTVGQTIRMKVDGRGRVSKIDLPEGLGGNAASGDDVRQMFADSFLEFPEEPVAIGGTWNATAKGPSGEKGEVNFEVTHRLVGVDKGKATIEQTFKVDYTKLQMPNGAKMNVTKSTDASVLDLVTCTFTDMSCVMTIDQQGVGGMRITSEMVMKSTVKQTEPPAPKAKQEKPAEAAKTGR